jgi:hypothetical protein
MKSKVLFILIILGVFLACSKKNESQIFRNIGHTLLLQSGDSTSRVLPIKSLGENTYIIAFESEFQLNPDTLINIVQRHLTYHSVKNEYRVNVYSCEEKNIVYGYEVTKTNDFSIPCLGRVYPKACYKIEIQLLKTALPKNVAIGITTFGILLFGFLLFKKKAKKPDENQDFISIGSFNFYPKSKQLIFEKEEIILSEKETKLLLLLSEKPNEIIEREVLLKEVWEKEGIFVTGRSLDVLVSKLRKKLQNDPNIKINNSHGKGYGLEM